MADKHSRRDKRDPRFRRNLSDVSDGGAPQSTNASGDGAASTGNTRTNVDAMQDEDLLDGAANPDSTPLGAAGSRRTNQREAGSRRASSLQTGATRNNATDASHSATGTSRRASQPGSGSLHGGYDSVSRLQDTDPTKPR
ncbi:MAG TPA: hypothetical protein VF254_06330, partial [Gammaproteobacteria bacterium]